MFSLFTIIETASAKALKPCAGGVGVVAIGEHVQMNPAAINAQRDPGGPAS